jgi:TorA maturation chaperone TorD
MIGGDFVETFSVNKKLLIGRFQFYNVFFHYYTNRLWDQSIWSSAVSSLFEQINNTGNEEFYEGINLLQNLVEDDITEAKFDFNRLFIGPNKLLAPPYESVYIRKERVLMQNETLIIRNFYESAGLTVSKLGKEPDDYIGFELEFICYLLHNLINGEEENVRCLELYVNFMEHHFLKWVQLHCIDVVKHSESKICLGMALILKAFVGQENEFIKTL